MMNLKKYLNKFLTAKGILFFLAVMYLIPKTFFTSTGLGLDPSWKIGMNLALKENLIWGKDVIFTYGPLGYLTFGLPIYVSKLSIVLFKLFIIGNGVYFIMYLFKSVTKKRDVFFIFLLLLFMGHFLFFTSAIALYFYFTFHIFHYLKHKNSTSYILVSMCCLLAFYIKVNTGIILNVLFAIFVLYNYTFRTINYKKNSLFLLGHFFILYILSFPLKTDLPNYILNSFSIINYYNDAMPIVLNDNFIVLRLLAILSLLFLVIAIGFKIILKSFYEIFLFLNIFLLIFIVFKQSFVRADDGHYSLFFLGISFIGMLLYLFSKNKKIKKIVYYFSFVVAIISMSFSGEALKTIRSKTFTFNSSFTDKNECKIEDNMRRRLLPSGIIEKIGDKSVDVLGHEISYVHYNNLRYNPRPVIQSYQSYAESLIKINQEKYTSNSAPDYVLYHFAGLDMRHPFWDEPMIYLSLFTNYSIVEYIPQNIGFEICSNMDNRDYNLILFKKNATQKEITRKVLKDSIVTLNSRITIPKSDNIIYLNVDAEYTFLGKVRRLLYQPSLALLSLDYENLNLPNTKYRLVLPIMKSGVPINKKVLTFEEALVFFMTKGKGNLNATSFLLEGNPQWFNKSLKIKYTEYVIHD
jgi:hypothetical protein